MSTIEMARNVQISLEECRKFVGADEILEIHAIRIAGHPIGVLNKYKRADGHRWQVCLFNHTLYGYGSTATDAIRDAFGVRLVQLRSEVERAEGFRHVGALIVEAESISS